MEPISVMIADDDPAIREALVTLVGGDAAMDLVGAAKDAAEAIDLARERQPDVAVLDARMPAGGGPRAAREIRRGSPRTRIVALSASEDQGTILQMLEAGASAYVSKADPSYEIVRAIRRSLHGRSTLSRRAPGDLAEALVERMPRRNARELRNHISASVRRVIDENGLHMVFQPVVELRSGRIVAVEALARILTRPRRSPEFWFAQAREAGVGVELELAAVSRAIASLPRIPPGARLSVNLSPEAILDRNLAWLLEEVPPTRLIVEVTEQTDVVDPRTLAQELEPLRTRGLMLAVDDVGAGFSSLGRVVELRPDFLKLDLSLINGIERDPVRRSLVRNLVAFAQSTECETIAEGIESDAQVEALLDLGVELGQGFRLGRPGPLPQGDSEGVLRWGGRHAFSDDGATAPAAG